MQDQKMKKISLVALAFAGALFVPATSPAQYASTVVAYDPGAAAGGYTTDPTAALGAPSVLTVDPDPIFGGTYPVDPFNPPYLPGQIVSIGAGGSLTLQFSTPILNNASHPYGIDFNIFGNSGFIITNGDYSGGGVTDGSLFGNNTGSTLVQVSADGSSWYTLNPALAPTVDGLYPTDGSGNPQLAVNPGLTSADFAGQGLTGIQSIYNGSAGGTGYDISWAIDSNSNSVSLASVDYVRIEVVSGTSEIDAVSAVPEPAAWAIASVGAVALFWNQRRKA